MVNKVGTENKKEKVISIGLTQELMTYMDKWTEENMEAAKTKEEKPGLAVKRVIVEMAKGELEKINKELQKNNITDEEWDRCIKKVHKISELVQWY